MVVALFSGPPFTLNKRTLKYTLKTRLALQLFMKPLNKLRNGKKKQNTLLLRKCNRRTPYIEDEANYRFLYELMALHRKYLISSNVSKLFQFIKVYCAGCLIWCFYFHSIKFDMFWGQS